MKKTKSVGKVLLVTLLVSAVAAGLFELSLRYLGMQETFVGLGIIGAFAMILIIASWSRDTVPPKTKWAENSREKLWQISITMKKTESVGSETVNREGL